MKDAGWVDLSSFTPAPTAIHPHGAPAPPKLTHLFNAYTQKLCLCHFWLHVPSSLTTQSFASTDLRLLPSHINPLHPHFPQPHLIAFSSHTSVLAVLFRVPRWTLPFPRVAFSDTVLQMCLKYSLSWKHFLTPQFLQIRTRLLTPQISASFTHKQYSSHTWDFFF